MKRVLLSVLLLWVGETYAQFQCEGPTWGVATLRSHHFNKPNTYAENNLGLGLERACGNWRIVGGFYRNSTRDTSLYAGAAWMPLSWRELHFGGFAGLFTGYSKSLLPAGAFLGSWEGRRYGLNLLYFPPYEDFKGLLVLQAKWRFP